MNSVFSIIVRILVWLVIDNFVMMLFNVSDLVLFMKILVGVVFYYKKLMQVLVVVVVMSVRFSGLCMLQQFRFGVVMYVLWYCQKVISMQVVVIIVMVLVVSLFRLLVKLIVFDQVLMMIMQNNMNSIGVNVMVVILCMQDRFVLFGVRLVVFWNCSISMLNSMVEVICLMVLVVLFNLRLCDLWILIRLLMNLMLFKVVVRFSINRFDVLMFLLLNVRFVRWVFRQFVQMLVRIVILFIDGVLCLVWWLGGLFLWIWWLKFCLVNNWISIGVSKMDIVIVMVMVIRICFMGVYFCMCCL